MWDQGVGEEGVGPEWRRGECVGPGLRRGGYGTGAGGYGTGTEAWSVAEDGRVDTYASRRVNMPYRGGGEESGGGQPCGEADVESVGLQHHPGIIISRVGDPIKMGPQDGQVGAACST